MISSNFHVTFKDPRKRVIWISFKLQLHLESGYVVRTEYSVLAVNSYLISKHQH